MVSLRSVLPLIFTSDPKVSSIAQNLVLFAALTHIPDGINALLGAVTRSIGRPLGGCYCYFYC